MVGAEQLVEADFVELLPGIADAANAGRSLLGQHEDCHVYKRHQSQESPMT